MPRCARGQALDLVGAMERWSFSLKPFTENSRSPIVGRVSAPCGTQECPRAAFQGHVPSAAYLLVGLSQAGRVMCSAGSLRVLLISATHASLGLQRSFL